jgi:hypothetical protein
MAFRNPVHTIPASSIRGQIPGSQIDGPVDLAWSADTVTGPVDGGQVTPGSLPGGALAPGGITFTQLEQAIMEGIGQKWWDFGGSASKWTKLGGTTPLFTSEPLADASGGTAMRAVGYGILWRPDILIPYDPRVLYRVSFTVRQTVAASVTANQRVYLGLMGVAADRVTLVNTTGANSSSNQAYCAARSFNLTTGAGWTTFTGYVQGYGTTAGDSGPNNSLLTPMALHPSVRYVSPLMFLNYTGGTGTQEIDSVSIEVVPTGPVNGGVHIVPGTIIGDRFSADAFDGKTMTAVTMNTAQLNAATVNGVTITGTSTVTGATVQTAASGNRVAMSTGTGTGGGAIGKVSFFTEVTNDNAGSVIGVGPADGATRALVLTAPKSALNPNPASSLTLSYDPETTQPTAQLPALLVDSVRSFGKVEVAGNLTAIEPGGNPLPVRGQQSGIRLTTFASATSNISPIITFATPFASPPAMTTSINSAPGTIAGWYSRPISVTTTGFQILVQSGDTPLTAAAFSSVPISWTATPTTQ